MRSISILPALIAAFLSALIIGLIVVTLLGGGNLNIIFPGLGLIISMWFMIALPAIVDVIIIAFALFFKSMSGKK